MAAVVAPFGREGRPGASAAKRCKRPQQPCARNSECCGVKKKRSLCGFSHGGGSVERTCCGKAGAACDGTALGCCIPLLCGPTNTCVEPTTAAT